MAVNQDAGYCRKIQNVRKYNDSLDILQGEITTATANASVHFFC